ncbi:MAG: hypothetical protein E7668_03435 [Ruminococcaceae bacterium]|nr:hypothetical protein [Oscillospiraceae bacterium]
MSKKLICLLLSLILLLGVLSGCAEKTIEDAKEDKSDQASAEAKTLALYLMSEKEVSAETEKMVENAVNRITEQKFKTRLDLHYIAGEEAYYKALQASFDARAEAKANGTLAVVEPDDGEDEMEMQDGVIRIKYPTIADYQVDIFYLGGVDRFNEYKNAGMLSKLDEELNSASKEIRKYVPAQFLDNMKSVNGGTYAIPTGTVIGEYTYLLLNKDALTAASRLRTDNNYSSYTSLTCADVKDFVEFVNDPNAKLEDTYYPIYTNLDEEELLSNLQFWGVDEEGALSEAFSVLGGYYNRDAEYKNTNTYAPITNLFANEQFVSELTTLKEYRVNGCYYDEETDKDKKFAVGYVKGGAELAEIYGEDYVMVPVEYPRLEEEELYRNMFGVCSYTTSVARSMEIVTFLNTNEEFRNLILFGLEGEHYQMIDTFVENEYGETYKQVKRLNEDYVMDAAKTGNMLITYNTEGTLVTIKDYIIAQNQDAKVKLSLGFTPDYNGFAIDKEGLQEIRTLSDRLWEAYQKCDTMESFNTFLADAQQEVAESVAVQKHLDADHGTDDKGAEKACDGKCGSLQCSYTAWLKAQKIIKK